MCVGGLVQGRLSGLASAGRRAFISVVMLNFSEVDNPRQSYRLVI